MLKLTCEQKIHYTLRLAMAMCFLGHGAFGIITKPIWCNYFAVFGINQVLAYRLMPLVGTVDILLGITMLVYPVRAIPAWLVVWGFMTALLRPLSGEPFAELIERAGNFGTPLALLLLSGASLPMAGKGKKQSNWFTRINPESPIDAATFTQIRTCLRIVVFLFLLGHGWLNMTGKKGLIDQYTAFGFADPVNTARLIGLFEIIAACTVLVRPFRPILLALLIWKTGTELFYPHHELFEWVERGGSYGALLGLWLMTRETRPRFIALAT